MNLNRTISENPVFREKKEMLRYWRSNLCLVSWEDDVEGRSGNIKDLQDNVDMNL